MESMVCKPSNCFMCGETEKLCFKAYQQGRLDQKECWENGRAEREKEIIDLIYFFEKTWNKESHKRVPKLAISELVEFIMQNDTKERVDMWLKEQ